ncbi:MAG TPA: Crp/Fnr family transcriptional regulator [Acidimicrobiales bacterium]|nr:Crp/Fnr family transcriptional regulator [Acidimicrobiales bacterium]
MTTDRDADEVLWDAFRSAGERRRYYAGSALFLEGDPPGTVFAVESGRVSIISESGDSQVELSTTAAGHFLGEVSAIDGLPRSASAIAATDVDAIVLPAGRFNQLLESQPQLAMRVMRLLANRLRLSTQERVRHRHGDAITRIAAALVTASEERGTPVGTLTRVPVEARELAAHVDGDHEMTSRALAGLEGEGWIEVGAEGIDILNLPSLRRLAEDAGTSW